VELTGSFIIIKLTREIIETDCEINIKKMLLVRFILISLIIYMIIRSFVRYNNEAESPKLKKDPDKSSDLPNKKVSKEVGEYIDYEELDKKE
jgi:hypothetical protein